VQADAQAKAKQLEIEEKRMMVDAADRADKMEFQQDKAGGELLLANRKQIANEELGERKLVIDAQRVGVMGRSADAAVLQRDRELAIQMAQTIKAENAANKTGESGTPEGV
jgi:hypothetical protein